MGRIDGQRRERGKNLLDEMVFHPLPLVGRQGVIVDQMEIGGGQLTA